MVSKGEQDPVRCPASRTTKQKRVLREVIETHSRPMTVEEILHLARKHLPSLGMATVYRAVNVGVEEGWLSAVQLPGAGLHYEPVGKGHHHFFHCRDCGKVYDVDGCLGPWDQLTPKGFKLESHEVVLQGLCERCNK